MAELYGRPLITKEEVMKHRDALIARYRDRPQGENKATPPEMTWAHIATVPEHGDACLCLDFSQEDACRTILGREPNYRHGEIEITDLVKCVKILTRETGVNLSWYPGADALPGRDAQTTFMLAGGKTPATDDHILILLDRLGRTPNDLFIKIRL